MIHGGTLARAAFLVIIVSLLSKVIGFAREIVIAALLGATSAGDTFRVAVFVPAMLFGIVAYAFTNTFIPLLAEQETRSDPQALNRFVANVTNAVAVLMIGLTAFSALFNPWIVKIIAPGFNLENYQIAVKLTYILIPNIILFGFIGLTTGYLNFRQIFVIPRVGGIIFNILAIALMVFLVPKANVCGAAAAMTLAYGGQSFFLLVAALKQGYNFRMHLNFRDPDLLYMFRLAIPLIIGTVFGMLAQVASRMFASTLSEGSISSLDYARCLNDFALEIFVSAIAVVYFPSLSRAGTARRWADYNNNLLRAVTLVFYIMIPVAAGFMVLSKPVVSLFFERGAFSAQATVMTSTALFYYSLGLIGFSFQNILGQAFYAVQDTITPIKNGVMMVLLNVLLTFFLIKYMGLAGIALSTSIAASLMVLYLAKRLQQKIPGLSYRPVREVVLKGVLAVLIMAAGVIGCDHIFAQLLTGKAGLLIRVVSEIVLGGMLYIISLYYLRVSEAVELVGWLKNLGTKTKRHKGFDKCLKLSTSILQTRPAEAVVFNNLEYMIRMEKNFIINKLEISMKILLALIKQNYLKPPEEEGEEDQIKSAKTAAEMFKIIYETVSSLSSGDLKSGINLSELPEDTFRKIQDKLDKNIYDEKYLK